MSEVPGFQLERFPISELTPDEIGVIHGIHYNSLGETFAISPRVLGACIDVWNTQGIRRGPTRSEAVARARSHFSKLADQGDETARKIIANLEGFENEPIIIETGCQFYLDGPEVIAGRIHHGEVNTIVLRNSLDGIADNRSIVQIHKHPDNEPQSFTDIIGILAKLENVPERCMYHVVGPDEIHTMFPTLDTPRVELEDIKAQISEHAQRWVKDPQLKFTDSTKEIAQQYRLGYYSSRKVAELTRVK